MNDILTSDDVGNLIKAFSLQLAECAKSACREDGALDEDRALNVSVTQVSGILDVLDRLVLVQGNLAMRDLDLAGMSPGTIVQVPGEIRWGS